MIYVAGSVFLCYVIMSHCKIAIHSPTAVCVLLS